MPTTVTFVSGRVTRSAVSACCRSSGTFLAESGVMRPDGRGAVAAERAGRRRHSWEGCRDDAACDVGGRGPWPWVRGYRICATAGLRPDPRPRRRRRSPRRTRVGPSTTAVDFLHDAESYFFHDGDESSSPGRQLRYALGSRTKPPGRTTRTSGSPLRYCAEHRMPGRRACRSSHPTNDRSGLRR